MKKIWKRIMAACCIAVMIVTLPGRYVLADEYPAEERCIIDAEEEFSEDILTEDSLGIYDEASTLEESDAEIPAENAQTDLINEPVDADEIREDQVEEVVDNMPVQETQTIEDTDAEELCGAVSHSRDEAVAWANSKVGQSLDYDGYYGAQCVDFIYYYYVYLGQAAPGGNANQFANGGRYTPSGWSYQSSPLPGDIAVWTGGTYGHVAIVTEIRGSQMVCVEQNYNNKQYVTPNLHNINAQTYIRPDFPVEPSHNPNIYFDSAVSNSVGKVSVSGWAFDSDNVNVSLDIHVYAFANGQAYFLGSTQAQNSRPDVHSAFGCGNNHGFSADFYLPVGGTVEVNVAAINIGSGENAWATSKYISVEKDTVKPTISNWKISDISSAGYTVTCDVSDNVGVKKVAFPTWTEINNQDDIFSDWQNTTLGDVSNGKATYRVKTSDHSGQVNCKYCTHIYAFDYMGNTECIGLEINVPAPVTNIGGCTVTLSTTSYTYNGKAKKPTVTVKNGTTALTAGTDYTASYSNNTNAGTATVTITGKGNYTGTKSVTFTIKKAAAKLTFANASVSKTTKDTAFTNTLTKTTDGTVTFKSSNTSVATVGSTSGKVTIKGAGETTITATASAGTNYKAGSASYTLTVKVPAPAGFSDVQDPTHPFYKAIYWAADAGITKGYPDGTFGIDRSCTRGEAVMFLWRMAGQPAPVGSLSSPFSDVPKTHAFYKAILWASQRGITKGYSDGTFGINRTCTRGHIMTFIWRFKGEPAPKAVAKSPFSDVPKTHAYYKAILWGAQTGVTNGFSDGTFGIDKNCTRGQIVTFLYRIK